MHHGLRARSDAQAGGPSPTGYPSGSKVGIPPDLLFWYSEHASVLGPALSRALGRPSRRRLFAMPNHKDLKRLVRTRMAETQENYTQALSAVLSGPALEPVPAPWHISGTHRVSYEAGLMPNASSYHGSRVVRLRLRAGFAEPAGFGTLMQSISAARYAGRRVRFAAAIRTHEVSDWAGLWLGIDTAAGTDKIDNMYDRGLRQSTEWQQAAVVLDVSRDATSLHFGVLLSGSGAVDLALPRFEAVSTDVPVTAKPSPALPEEPQALNFGQPAAT